MISEQEAIDIAKKAIPGSKVKKIIDYNDLYILYISTGDEFEDDYDPFYSVDKESGHFEDFSIIDDGDFSIINEKFQNASEL